MHNIKFIRENFKEFKDLLKKRNIEININKIIDLDKKSRLLIQNKENLERKKKEISKSKDQKLFKKSKEITQKITSLSQDQTL